MSASDLVAMDPTTQAHQVVIATNRGTRPFRAMYASVPYILEPGVPRNIPYLAAVLWFGNPALRDLDPNNPDRRYRTNEVERLSGKYACGSDGWYSDEIRTTTSFNPEDQRDQPMPYEHVKHVDGRALYRHPNLPKVELTDYDGNRIISVIEDPDGSYSMPSVQAQTKSELETLREQMDMLIRQQEMLLAQMSQQDPDAAAEFGKMVPVKPDVDHDTVSVPDHDNDSNSGSELNSDSSTPSIDPETGMSSDMSADPTPDPTKRGVGRPASPAVPPVPKRGQ